MPSNEGLDFERADPPDPPDPPDPRPGRAGMHQRRRDGDHWRLGVVPIRRNRTTGRGGGDNGRQEKGRVESQRCQFLFFSGGNLWAFGRFRCVWEFLAGSEARWMVRGRSPHQFPSRRTLAPLRSVTITVIAGGPRARARAGAETERRASRRSRHGRWRCWSSAPRLWDAFNSE